MQITLYSKPNCQPCRAAKRKMGELDIIYTERDVTADPAAAERVRELDYSSVPVTEVELGDGATWTWAGYAPSQLERLHLHLEGYDAEVAA